MPPVRTPKSPAKRRSPKKNHQSPEPDVEVKPPVLYQSRITNDLYHQILIKTLEHALSKNMDWYEMSQEILADEEAMSVIRRTLSPKKGKAKGKGKGKGKEKEAEQDNENEANEKKESNKDLTGTELREMRATSEVKPSKKHELTAKSSCDRRPLS